MIVDYLTALTSVVVLCVAVVLQPARATCPRGWWLRDGVRRSGAFSCLPDSVGPLDDQPGGYDPVTQPPGELDGVVYCTGGSVPVVVDDRTVSCQARH